MIAPVSQPEIVLNGIAQPSSVGNTLQICDSFSMCCIVKMCLSAGFLLNFNGSCGHFS